MQATVITLFPDYFRGPFDCGPTRVARADGKLALSFVNPRDFTSDAHRTVDDYPFGGGAGMVMKPEPLAAAIENARQPSSLVVLLSPQGELFSQALAEEFSRSDQLVLVCGRYKGVDERVRSLCDREVSAGDYVLAGGEAAAVIIIEAIARLLPGAVGDEDSVATDSFTAGILDAPYYTRPREFRGREVPEVLVSGDHSSVARWRREQALKTTAQRRPELLRTEVLTESEREFLCRELEKEIIDG
ncbi:tRNA (guanosine(37)-N1)-methyltransferase TrmD [candidate division WOR-3 bacterium]|nr:tRNA (guanosine(37)-N1)-methyltransferase TrmD [candidate division WOR-3 bacterium]